MYYNTFRRRQLYDRKKKLIVIRNGFLRLGVQHHDYERQIKTSSLIQESE